MFKKPLEIQFQQFMNVIIFLIFNPKLYYYHYHYILLLFFLKKHIHKNILLRLTETIRTF